MSVCPYYKELTAGWDRPDHICECSGNIPSPWISTDISPGIEAVGKQLLLWDEIHNFRVMRYMGLNDTLPMDAKKYQILSPPEVKE